LAINRPADTLARIATTIQLVRITNPATRQQPGGHHSVCRITLGIPSTRRIHARSYRSPIFPVTGKLGSICCRQLPDESSLFGCYLRRPVIARKRSFKSTYSLSSK
jgi:hypothetical protein